MLIHNDNSPRPDITAGGLRCGLTFLTHEGLLLECTQLCGVYMSIFESKGSEVGLHVQECRKSGTWVEESRNWMCRIHAMP